MNKRNNYKLKTVFFVTMALGLLLIIVGVTFAIVQQTLFGEQNTISTGAITMNYIEDVTSLSVDNPLAVSDNDAKIGEDYFSFTIESSATGSIIIGYYIYFTISDSSTLDNNAVKVYLSSVSNPTATIANEIEKVAPTLVSNLVPFNVTDLTYDSTSKNRILYTNYFNFNYDNTPRNHYYRFRMWIDETYFNNNQSTLITNSGENDTIHQTTTVKTFFKLKINVIGINGEPKAITAT